MLLNISNCNKGDRFGKVLSSSFTTRRRGLAILFWKKHLNVQTALRTLADSLIIKSVFYGE